ncbi:MAG: hypothetical protein FJZ00_00040 [Candidatus Sericytochromatia bacterium]|uniref:Uncharacterized protein n=1 Tax=Candidatus Tanganyikabacteria bacterium TaxID=2961651 RepID=A0A937X3F4_9BACT|nr:hypothetical protein [Candidatus Tanganyikabacteria bacterium]
MPPDTLNLTPAAQTSQLGVMDRISNAWRSGPPALAAGAESLDPVSRYRAQTEARIQQAQDKKTAGTAWNLLKTASPILHVPEVARRWARDAYREWQPLTNDQQRVFDTLSPGDQQAAFRRLAADQRNRFGTVTDTLGNDGFETTRQAQDGLRRLLADGSLAQADSQGGTTLDNLHRLATGPLTPELQAAGLHNRYQLTNMVNMLADPDSVFQGEDTPHCVPASIQTVLARTDKAELARVSADLLTQGQSQLVGGQTMPLDASELFGANSRTTTDELLQGSFSRYARQFPVDGPFSGQDEHGGGRPTGNGGVHGGGRPRPRPVYGGGEFLLGAEHGGGRPKGNGGVHGGGRRGGSGIRGGGDLPDELTQAGAQATQDPGAQGIRPAPERDGAAVPGGLSEYQAQRLYEDVAGRATVPVAVTDANRGAAWDGLRRALTVRPGERPAPVSIGVVGEDRQGRLLLHQVTVVGMDGDRVRIHDSGSGRSTWVPADQIRKDLNAILLPPLHAAGTGWEQSLADPGSARDAEEHGGGRKRGGVGG